MFYSINSEELARFRSQLIQAFEAQPHELPIRNLTTPGGPIPRAQLYWVPSRKIWAFFREHLEDYDNKWICWFGTSLSHDGQAMVPSIEINLSFDPQNRATAGRALKDQNGIRYLGHKGGLGGGRGGQMTILDFARKVRGFVREPIQLREGV
ncbi:MAG: hypothetical protein AB7K35_17205, partial [Pseudorhodoplanes sp.]